MDQNIRPRAPFTLRNKNTEQECEFQDQAEVDNFRAEVEDASAWQLVTGDDAAEAQPQAEAAPEAPAAAPAVTEEAPAPTAQARKPRATAKK